MRKLRWGISLFIFLVIGSNLQAQSRLGISAVGSYFLYHSENSAPITQEENFRFQYGISGTFRFNFQDEYPVLISYGLSRNRTTIKEFQFTDEQGFLLGKANSHLTYWNLPLDISYLFKESERVYLGGGLSGEASLRRAQVESLIDDITTNYLIGAHLSAGLNILKSTSDRYFGPDLKVRYLRRFYTIGFERQTDKFNLSHLTIQLGFTYAWKR